MKFNLLIEEYIYTTQNLIRAEILILFAGGPVYLIPRYQKFYDRYVAQLSLYKHVSFC